MNNRKTKQDWEKQADEFGYKSLYQMLYKYYVERGMTTKDIGHDLDISHDRVTQLLRSEGIPLRKRGGIRG